MPTFTAACVQLRSGRNVEENMASAEDLIREAARNGADYVQTPEMTNIVERSRSDLFAQISDTSCEPIADRFRHLAAELGIYLHIGSVALPAGHDHIANRAFLFDPDGRTLASYDKIHMFDVDLPNGESWRESATYEPGRRAVVADMPWLRIGLGICYDVRFAALFRAQAKAGAGLLTAPAAFTRQTGEAHWHVLQRARAIENGAYVISAAQGGLHADGRETFGHSIIVDPWGAVVAEIDNDEPGVVLAEIRSEEVESARQRIPALLNERAFEMPLAEPAAEAVT